MSDLSRDAMSAAVTEGVRQAFVDVLTGASMWPISHDNLMQAIKEGVERAVYRAT